jgi:Domain of unknown function (DUF5658)
MKRARTYHHVPNQPLSATGVRQRAASDRRALGWRTFVYSILAARRKEPRRRDDKAMPYYTDHYDGKVSVLFFSILMLCVADAGLTLQILARGGTELNPLMDRLLDISPQVFFIGKYVLTSAGLLFSLLHINFKVLKLFPMRHVLYGLVGFYLFLVGYEVVLLSQV